MTYKSNTAPRRRLNSISTVTAAAAAAGVCIRPIIIATNDVLLASQVLSFMLPDVTDYQRKLRAALLRILSIS